MGSGVFSAGVLGTFMPISTYLIDAYQLYAASALAANTVLRSLTGALLPLAGPAMVCLRVFRDRANYSLTHLDWDGEIVFWRLLRLHFRRFPILFIDMARL
jgi:hypothetical protein